MRPIRFGYQAGRLVRCYGDPPANVVAMLSVSFDVSAERIAVIAGTTRATYREFGERTEVFAASLARIGVQKGDRVAVAAPNGLEVPAPVES